MQRPTSSLETFGKTARRTGLVLGALGAASIAAGINFAAAASEQIRAERTLAAVIRGTGTEYSSVREEILATTAALQAKTNTGDEEQLRILSRLIPVIGNVDQAMAALPAILDAAATSGLNAASIAGTLGRALSGTANTAESVGLVFEETATFSERLAIVLEKVGGAAEANVDPMDQLTNSLGDVKESIGVALLPILEPLATNIRIIADEFGAWAKENPELTRTVFLAATAAGVLGVGLLTIGIVTPIASAGVLALSGAMTGLTTITLGAVAATTALIARFGLIVTAAVAAVAAINTFLAFTTDDAGFLFSKEGKDAFKDAEVGFRDFGRVLEAEVTGQISEFLDNVDFMSAAMDGLGTSFEDVQVAAEESADAIKEKFLVELGESIAEVTGAATSQLDKLGAAIRRFNEQNPDSPIVSGEQRQPSGFTEVVEQIMAEGDAAIESLDGISQAGNRQRLMWDTVTGRLVLYTTNTLIAAAANDRLTASIEGVNDALNPLAGFESNLAPPGAGRDFGRGGLPAGVTAASGEDIAFLSALIQAGTIESAKIIGPDSPDAGGVIFNHNIQLDSKQIDSVQGQQIEDAG